MSLIQTGNSMVLCDATVDLVSKHERPYKFRVTVTGKPPYARTRAYTIVAKDDKTAAFDGIERFTREMSHPLSILDAL